MGLSYVPSGTIPILSYASQNHLSPVAVRSQGTQQGLEEIRKENSLPILMFTSKNVSISKVRGLRAEADDYLTKPFDMDELIALIASLIRRYTRFNQQAGAIQDVYKRQVILYHKYMILYND